MKIIGKPTIAPFFFYTAKFFVLIFLLFYPLYRLSIIPINPDNFWIESMVTDALYLLGVAIIVLGVVALAGSTRIGLPNKDVALKKKGLYLLSRNPIYVGVYICVTTVVLTVMILPVILVAIYCIVVHHVIILGEERYLESKFNKEYLNYKSKVRRYL